MNNSAIKLQGVAYYVDCYKFWDLERCSSAFKSPEYSEIITQIMTKNRASRAGGMFNGKQLFAVIDFDDYEKSYEKYYATLPKNVRRDTKNSLKKFYFKEYNFNDFVYDFSEINHSQTKRKNNVNKWYLKDPTFFLGSNHGKHEWEDKRHFSKWYGLFKHYKNYKQGSVVTHEKLFAYVKVAVEGEMASINLIWAHADHLKEGAMFHLVTSVVSEMMSINTVRCLVYYGTGQKQWKERLQFKFQPIELIL